MPAPWRQLRPVSPSAHQPPARYDQLAAERRVGQRRDLLTADAGAI
jgi:hypothetical protein